VSGLVQQRHRLGKARLFVISLPLVLSRACAGQCLSMLVFL
jgi:hypothetical protein